MVKVTDLGEYRAKLADAVQRATTSGGDGGDGEVGDLFTRVALLERLADETRGELRHLRTEISDGRREERTRFIALIVATLGTGLAVAGVALAMQGNMLSSFQAGLAAVQASGQPRSDGATPTPIIIQLPGPTPATVQPSTPQQ